MCTTTETWRNFLWEFVREIYVTFRECLDLPYRRSSTCRRAYVIEGDPSKRSWTEVIFRGSYLRLRVSGPLMVYGFSNGPATQPIVHMDNLVHHNKTSTYTVARLSKRNSLASNYHWNLRIRSDHTFLLVYPWWYMEYSTRWVIAIHLYIIFFDVFVTSDIYSLRKHSSGIKNDHLRSLSHFSVQNST